MFLETLNTFKRSDALLTMRVYYESGKHEDARSHLELALTFYGHYGDHRVDYKVHEAQVFKYLASLHFDMGNLEAAERLLAQGEEHYRFTTKSEKTESPKET